MTASIVVPRLSAENFDECRRLFGWQSIDESLVDRLFEGFERSTRVTQYDRDDVLEDGEPTTWTVVERDGTDRWPQSRQHLDNELPCVYEWCRGHDINEAESWAELRHGSPDVGFDSQIVDYSGCWFVDNGQPPALNVYIHLEDDLGTGDVERLQRELMAVCQMLDDLVADAHKKSPEVEW